MDESETVMVLAALAQDRRLRILQAMAAHNKAITVSDLARRVAMRQNSLSSHLAILSRADLVTGQRMGRMIYYRLESRRLRQIVVKLRTLFQPMP